MAKVSRRKPVDPHHVQRAETEIKEYLKTVTYTVTEYSLEHLVQRLKADRYYVPEYQRKLIWKPPAKSKFIESLLMGLPIPFIFFWQADDGRFEIVDGSQRLRTISDFMDGKFALNGLELLAQANGLYFSDFPKSRQLMFSELSIRAIVLENATDAHTRTEMFARINTGGTAANEAEIRRGSLPGAFMDMVTALAESPEFINLTPVSASQVDQREREELITRYFAYLESFDPTLDHGAGDIPSYKEAPSKFYFAFVKAMNEKTRTEISETDVSPTIDRMRIEFMKMLRFVSKVSPNGFTKSETGNQVPRVRFESIAVGSALALRAKPEIEDIVADISPLLDSDDFKSATRSDAANVKSKLIGRIRLVRDWLVK